VKGYELEELMNREYKKKGTAGSPVKAVTEDGQVYNFVGVENEQQPDGGWVLWLKLEQEDG